MDKQLGGVETGPDGFEPVADQADNFSLYKSEQNSALWISLYGFRSADKGELAMSALKTQLETAPTQCLVIDYRSADYPEDLFETIQYYGQIATFLPRARVITLRNNPADPVAPLLALELEASGHDVTAVNDEQAVMDLLAS